MKYIDYVQLNPFQKAGLKIKNFFTGIPSALKKFFILIGTFFKKLVLGIGHGFAGYAKRFIKGDIFTKLSYIFMGVGNASKGQYIKGLVFFLFEIAYAAFLAFFGLKYIPDFTTLGTQQSGMNLVNGVWQHTEGQNSMLILLYGVVTILVTVIFFVAYIANTKSAYNAQEMKKNGEHLPTFVEEIKQFTDEKFHITMLSIPVLLISVFSVLPLIFMILIAFTNFDHLHPVPAKLFHWVGLETFSNVFSTKGATSMGGTFLELTEWTILWAIAATFLNYIMGMVVALMINKKGIKLKALWRTLFVITIAVPQFVTLLVMNQMLQENTGAINVLLEQYLHLDQVNFIGGEIWVARLTVIIINLWVGIPYTILITSGILMNIPADLYESATIDGAGPWKSFIKITLPYMLFVTTPYLITTFIGNINNFNVIYLLTNGQPTSSELYGGAGYTDLLVTWLFKLTMDKGDNNFAAAIGILVFIVCASLSLITFNLTKSAKDEEAFS